MNDEDISALADDEIEAARLGALIDHIGSADPARRTWARYHLIGEVLRSDQAPGRAAATPRADVVPLPARDRLRAPLAGLAIAASVAALSVVLVAGNRGEPTVTPALEVAQSGAVAPSVPAAAPAVDSIVGDEASGLVPAGAYDQRMNGYLVNFNEQRARLGMPGVHPYVRIVGFEQR